MSAPDARCADCGAHIEPVPGMERGWGEPATHVQGPSIRRGWDLCCRITYDPTNTSRIVSADFHHVAGETQRHYRAGVAS